MADNKVQTRQIGADVIVRSLDPEFNTLPTVYYMGNGRTFKEYDEHGSYKNTELIVDGDFLQDDGGADWIDFNLAGFGSGRVYNTSTSSAFNLAQQKTTQVPGATYHVSIDIVKMESGTLNLTFAGTQVLVGQKLENKRYTFDVVATNTFGFSLVVSNLENVSDFILNRVSVVRPG